MVRDGILYGSALVLLGILGGSLGGFAWAVPQLALAAFVLYFFRDPERAIPAGDVVVSPADGRVVGVQQVLWAGRPHWRVSIFLSLFDVHVNRAPVAGTIRDLSYTPGRFLMASRPEASVENEQNTVTIAGERFTITSKQIAGVLARRIVFRKKIGDRVVLARRIVFRKKIGDRV
ncbi:MAG: hypothetical protein A3J28_04350, partial [Acidobacteria bacterium RIFCSPLOWO2_12_FULL_60_22]